MEWTTQQKNRYCRNGSIAPCTVHTPARKMRETFFLFANNWLINDPRQTHNAPIRRKRSFFLAPTAGGEEKWNRTTPFGNIAYLLAHFRYKHTDTHTNTLAGTCTCHTRQTSLCNSTSISVFDNSAMHQYGDKHHWRNQQQAMIITGVEALRQRVRRCLCLLQDF